MPFFATNLTHWFADLPSTVFYIFLLTLLLKIDFT